MLYLLDSGQHSRNDKIIPMKIVIIEDHKMVRDLLREVCAKVDRIEVIGEAGTGREAVEVVLRTAPDTILLDIGLPDMNGFQVLNLLRRLGCMTQTIFLSGYCTEYTVYLVQQTDARGFLDKPGSTLSQISAALDAIDKGQTYFSKEFSKLQSRLRTSPDSFGKILSNTEQRMLVLLGALLSDGEIAVLLHISRETVEKHRLNIRPLVSGIKTLQNNEL
jgi:two-component system, NarL family, nitrate/nitrite response regulator NarL